MKQQGRFFYGWAIVAAASAVGFVEVLAFNPVLSVFLKPMAEEMGWSRTALSGVVAAGTLSGGVLTVIIGPILDRRGTRLVLLAALALFGGSLIVVSRVAALWQFYLVFGLARALSVGVLDVAIVVAVSNWFIRRRGRAIGIGTLGAKAGNALTPLFTQFLISGWGWRWAWRGLGIGAWAIALLPVALVMRRRPEDIGLLPDGGTSPPSPQPSPELAPFSGSETALPLGEPTWAARDAIRSPAFWLLTIALAQSFFGGGAINLHQVPYMTDMGIPPTTAVRALSLYAAVGAIGGLAWSFLADRISVKYCLAAAQALAAGGLGLLFLTRTTAMAYTYAIFYGLSYGGILPLFAIAWPVYFGRASLGTIRSMSWPIILAFNAMGPLFAGWIHDSTSSYQIALVVFVACYLMGGLWTMLARVPRAPSRAMPGPPPAPPSPGGRKERPA